MNERIKELAAQAGATVNERSGYTDYGTLDLDVEKFAELIIEECYIIMIKSYKGHINPQIGRDALNQHFGVER